MPNDRPIGVDELQELFADLTAFDDVFLAVSGGADSTALMHLAAAWRAAERPAGRLHVLTVNHGLRPQAADEVETVVAAAEALGIPADILTWTGSLPQTGVQQAARDVRYKLLLQRVGRSGGCAALVTAHHREDLAETVLMRLGRGAGVDGLAAMQSVIYRGDIAIVRPFLNVSTLRLRATLRATDTAWIEDPSNQNQDFERIRLRAARDARAQLGLTDEAMGLSARRMARARSALEQLTDQYLQPCLAKEPLTRCGVFDWTWSPGKIPDEIAVRILMRVLPAIGGTEQPPRLLRAERLWDDMQRVDFAGATLGNCAVVPVTLGGFTIYREPNRGTLPSVTLTSSVPLIWDNRFEIACGAATVNAGGCIRGFERQDLKAFDCDAGERTKTHPFEALAATPVVEDGTGLLWIPALNMHRDGPDGLRHADPAASLSCRFLVERISGRLGVDVIAQNATDLKVLK